MSVRQRSVCFFCRQSLSVEIPQRRWTTARQMATLQKRRPGRMELSGDVARSTARTERDTRPSKRGRSDPFGGMNITEARFAGKVRPRSQAEERRGSKHHKPERPEKPSNEPFKALKMQRRLASVSYDRRAAVKQSLAQRDDFSGFGLLPVLEQSIASQALPGLVDLSPTPIQRLAIPALLSDKGRRGKKPAKDEPNNFSQYLLAAETGSGKTLAYLLPLVNSLKQEELADKDAEKTVPSSHAENNSLFSLPSPPLSNEENPLAGKPKAIILLPTSELVDQVSAVAKQLAHTVKFRVAILSAAYSPTVIRSRLFAPNGVDLVITTPHLLQSIAETSSYVLSEVRRLVIDEADSLLDRSFSPVTSSILDRTSPTLRQLILCSATIPRNLDSYLHKRFPDLQRLTTPNLHAIPRRVQMQVVDAGQEIYKGNKDLACADTLYSLGKDFDEGSPNTQTKHVIVFVNEREKSDELATYLKSKGIDASALNRDALQRKDSGLLAAFTSPTSPSQDQTSRQDRVFDRRVRELRNVKVLVTTDIASRGIDTTAVKNVILYDVPHTSIDFIHRIGRVGRMGRRGKAIVLVGKDDRKDIVREVREGMFKGMALV